MTLSVGMNCPRCRRSLRRTDFGAWGWSRSAWLVLGAGIAGTAALAWALIVGGVAVRPRQHRGMAWLAMLPLVAAGVVMNRLGQARTVTCACGYKTRERAP